MPEQVLYLLGAGFSAPLGLPVMSNFLFKSRDQYFSNPGKYQYFDDVFRTIRQLADVKNYFKADLFNIEEILSILEMQRHFGHGEVANHDYIQYLRDVVQYYTPVFQVTDKNLANWHSQWLGNKKTSDFGNFVMCLFNIQAHENRDRGQWPENRFYSSKDNDPATVYSVLTLNYDLVLENLCEQINKAMKTSIAFNVDKVVKNVWSSPYLAKLHGTVATEGKIVPPTWNKGLHHDIADVWKLAYKLIATSTQIRFIGYSLPETDSYVKYLLKSAINEARNLKKIDVLCLDPKEEIKARYDDFVDFPNYRFKSGDVSTYLSHSFPIGGQLSVNFDFLEKLHSGFFK